MALARPAFRVARRTAPLQQILGDRAQVRSRSMRRAGVRDDWRATFRVCPKRAGTVEPGAR